MATLSQLVDTVATVEGIDSERLSAIARYIREAGLVSTGGRGKSAASMTEHHAANLLIAANAAGTARSAPEIVREYRALKTRKRHRATEFGTQLEQVIFAAKMETMDEYVLGLVNSFGSSSSRFAKRRYPSSQYVLRIEFVKPKPEATIQIWVGTETEFIFFRGVDKESDAIPRGDRREQTTISSRTIRAVAELLRE